MEKDGEKRAPPNSKPSGEVDWISELPESLQIKVLLNLPTKDVVKTSALSSRWRYLWQTVPKLDLEIDNFPDHDLFPSFVDRFLGFNADGSCCLHSFKVHYDYCGDGEPETGLIRRWVTTVVRQKVEHLHVEDDSYQSWEIEMPPTLYTCASLVSLKLSGVTLPSPPKFVSLPCLKSVHLTIVKFADDSTLETLISRCPALECLDIKRSLCDDIGVLRVRSQSLLRFTHGADTLGNVEGLVVEIDAPRLEYLKLSDHRTSTFVLNSLASSSSLVQADIDFVLNLSGENKLDPNDVQKTSMIRKFLVGISSVKDMNIGSSRTLEIIYDYSRCEPLPLFRNLSFLHVEFDYHKWEMLPTFLERCPNLKSLVLASPLYWKEEEEEEEGTTNFFGARCLISSLEYVKIEMPLKGKEMEMRLVAYLLEKSSVLKN